MLLCPGRRSRYEHLAASDPELFADDASMCEVVGDRLCGRDYLRPVDGQGRHVNDGVGAGAARYSAVACVVGSRRLSLCGLVRTAKGFVEVVAGQPMPVVMGQPLSG